MILEDLETFLGLVPELAAVPVYPLLVDSTALNDPRSRAISLNAGDEQSLPAYHTNLRVSTPTVTINLFARKYGDLVGMTEVVLRELDGTAPLAGSTQILRSKVVNTFQTTNNSSPIVYQTTLQLEISH